MYFISELSQEHFGSLFARQQQQEQVRAGELGAEGDGRELSSVLTATALLRWCLQSATAKRWPDKPAAMGRSEMTPEGKSAAGQEQPSAILSTDTSTALLRQGSGAWPGAEILSQGQRPPAQCLMALSGSKQR